ncbi:MAG: NAD(P)-dependent oxidoreductase [Lysobacterales bacterium]|jgi:nucleoside-diphosphate-sugar epimerase
MPNRPDPVPASAPIFVPGATGFIGRRLVAYLLDAGYGVRAAIRPDRDRDERLPPACEQFPVGLTDTDTLEEAVAGCSAVVYCAGSVRGRGARDFELANVHGVTAMAEVLERGADPPPLLLLSSLAASRPELSDYARSKADGERVLQTCPSMPWTILRPPAVYGPGDREMLPLLRLARGGWVVRPGPREQRLSLLHVDDLVTAVRAWLAAPDACLHRVYAIDDGTPGGYGWPDIGRALGHDRPRVIGLPRVLLNAAAHANLFLSRLLHYAPMLTPGKVRELVQPAWLCDNSIFSATTGWQPVLDLERGARPLFASTGVGTG